MLPNGGTRGARPRATSRSSRSQPHHQPVRASAARSDARPRGVPADAALTGRRKSEEEGRLSCPGGPLPLPGGRSGGGGASARLGFRGWPRRSFPSARWERRSCGLSRTRFACSCCRPSRRGPGHGLASRAPARRVERRDQLPPACAASGRDGGGGGAANGRERWWQRSPEHLFVPNSVPPDAPESERDRAAGRARPDRERPGRPRREGSTALDRDSENDLPLEWQDTQ